MLFLRVDELINFVIAVVGGVREENGAIVVQNYRESRAVVESGVCGDTVGERDSIKKVNQIIKI